MSRALPDIVVDAPNPLRVIAVELPDADWGARIQGLIGHKEAVYLQQIAASQLGKTPGLASRFTIATDGADPVSIVMVAAAGDFGILGHVFTVPSYRRRGISSRLLHAAIREEELRGATNLSLAVTPRSPASRIYERLGFATAWPAEDAMTRTAVTTPRSFGSGGISVEPLGWRDWPGMNWAMLLPPLEDEAVPRSSFFGVEQRGQVESAFLVELLEAGAPKARHHVLRGPNGAVAGWALLGDGRRGEGVRRPLDVHVLPGYEQYLPALLESAGESALWVTAGAGSASYEPALVAAGFTRAADGAANSWER